MIYHGNNSDLAIKKRTEYFFVLLTYAHHLVNQSIDSRIKVYVSIVFGREKSHENVFRGVA